MFKIEFDRAAGLDQEYKQMEIAFTYGMQLNRQGLHPISTMRGRMRDLFYEKELRRLLYTLRMRKGKSVCGDRDPCLVKKYR